MSQKTKTQTETPINETLGFTVPDTTSALGSIKAALREEHKQEEEEDKKKGKPKKKRPSKTICFCGDPNCGIGPFTETQGEEVDQQ